ncbi:hypothetical protein BN946_scf184753.g52 [Trametes cinnabarina]|uniref:Uncharacterized protein n=1 Tax=Pycnoporus cinnabarinus TaxID=5643 RepID=A0A060SS27_PYCCI|nr:hypothetical protein BN946_scf184753.g52 [Trametes cinnabarina]
MDEPLPAAPSAVPVCSDVHDTTTDLKAESVSILPSVPAGHSNDSSYDSDRVPTVAEESVIEINTEALRSSSRVEDSGFNMQSALCIEGPSNTVTKAVQGSERTSDGEWTDIEHEGPVTECLLNVSAQYKETAEVVLPLPVETLETSDSAEESTTASTVSRDKAAYAPSTSNTRETETATSQKHSYDHGAQLTVLDGRKTVASSDSVANTVDVCIGPPATNSPRVRKHTPEHPDWAVAPDDPPTCQLGKGYVSRAKRSKIVGKEEIDKATIGGSCAIKSQLAGRRVGSRPQRQREMGVGANQVQGMT